MLLRMMITDRFIRLEQTSFDMIDDPEWDERNIMVPYRNALIFNKSNAVRATSPLIQMQIVPAFRKQLRRLQSGEILRALQELKECRTLN